MGTILGKVLVIITVDHGDSHAAQLKVAIPQVLQAAITLEDIAHQVPAARVAMLLQTVHMIAQVFAVDHKHALMWEDFVQGQDITARIMAIILITIMVALTPLAAAITVVCLSQHVMPILHVRDGAPAARQPIVVLITTAHKVKRVQIQHIMELHHAYQASLPYRPRPAQHIPAIQDTPALLEPALPI